MSTHTPGPWKCLKVNPTSGDWGHRILADRDLDLIIQMPDPDEEAANARLIAAAPDMLAALKDALAWIEYQRKGNSPGSSYGTETAQTIRAAIAKAEGTS